MVRDFKATQAYLRCFGFEDKEGLDLVVVCGTVEKKLTGPWDVPDTLTLPIQMPFLDPEGMVRH